MAIPDKWCPDIKRFEINRRCLHTARITAFEIRARAANRRFAAMPVGG